MGGKSSSGTGGRSASSGPPRLPPQLSRGTSGEVQARQRERVAIMERTYPGVKFSTSTSNPSAVAQNAGVPGVGMPRAIYDGSVLAVTDPATRSALQDAVTSTVGVGGYVTYTTAKMASGLSFQEVFGVLKGMHAEDPNSVSFTVDRLGKNTAFSIKRSR